jgi:hypothetical protein
MRPGGLRRRAAGVDSVNFGQAIRLTEYYSLVRVLAKSRPGIECKKGSGFGGGNSCQVAGRREVEKSGLACRQRLMLIEVIARVYATGG